MRQSAEPKGHSALSVLGRRRGSLPCVVCSCGGERCRSTEAEDRQLWAGSLGPLTQQGPLEKERRRRREAGGRVDWGWQGVSSPAGFKEGVREGPSDTEKAPVFLMNLHNGNVAE